MSNSNETSHGRKKGQKRTAEEETHSPDNIDYDSDRPESDGEDFNLGGRPRSRPEATGEDF